MANLLVREGKPTSLYDTPRQPVALGQPLVIRYLRLALRHAPGRQQLLVSTFLKDREDKTAAAEAVNYFNGSARFDADGWFDLADFGGRCYGHPLCYYSRSYLGESIRLTTRVMELDRVDRRTMRLLREGLASVGGLPVMAGYLVYTSLAMAGLRAAERLAALFARDDAIIGSHSLDLWSDGSGRHLQQGRILCLPDADESEFLDGEAWRITPDHRLVETATGREYRRTSYFVLEIATTAHPAYEKFDAFQDAAMFLRRANAPEHPAELLETSAALLEAWRDFRGVEELERLAIGGGAGRDRLMAFYRRLSPAMQRLYGPHLERHLVRDSP